MPYTFSKCLFFIVGLQFGGFPHSSVGKESACNAKDSGSIPGSRWSTGEGIGYPPQYSWASLVAQQVKNTPSVQETWVQSLGWEDVLEKGKATHSIILAWRIPWTIQPKRLQTKFYRASLAAQMVKHLPAKWETRVWPLCREDPLEKETATHSSILAWEIPWTEEPCRLQSLGSQSWTQLSDFTYLLQYWICFRCTTWFNIS